jgi:DNA-binding NarL/FixJ family response regulator
MIANGIERRALVVEASPRWRAALAEALRAEGWAVSAVATPAEAVAGQPYHLAVLEASAAVPLPEALALLSHLATAGTRCVLLASLSVDDVPADLARHPLVVGTLTRRDFRPETLLELVGGLGPRPAAGTPALTATAGPRVLVVEDDAQWRHIYEELLVEAGFAPYFAVSYGEARGWLQRVEFALALVDLNLASSAAPEGNRDGFYLLRATRQRNVPAVVVSALGDPADIDRAYDEFGIFAFVEKEGFDRRNFLRLLGEALQAGRAPVPAAPGEHSNPALEALTPREREVLALLIQGHTNRQIAEALLITPNTTKKHVDHILQKLGVSTRAGAVAAALRETQ